MFTVFFIDDNKLESINKLLEENSDLYSFYNDLNKNEYKLYTTFLKEKGEIVYVICSKIKIYELTIKLNQEYKLNDLSILDVIAYYIFKRDKLASTNQLKKYYGDNYHQIELLTSLNNEEKNEYYRAINDISNLTFTMEERKVDLLTLKIKRLVINRKLEHAKYVDLDLILLDKDQKDSHISYKELFGIYKDIGNDYSKYIFSNEDNLFLMNLNYRVHTPAHLQEKVIENIINIFLTYPRKHIEINKELYRIDKDIKPIKTYISSTYKIVCDIDNNEVITLNDLFVLCFKKETNTFYLKKFNSFQENLLYTFSIEHPNLPYYLFEEELSSKLIPILNKNIEISENVLNKVQNYISEIQYYIEYNDENSENLSISTIYLLNGKKVNNVEFSKLKSDEYHSFINKLEDLSLPQNEKIINKDKIYEILTKDLTSLNLICRIFLSDNLKAIKHKKTINYKVTAKSNIDWFKIDIKSDEYTDEELKTILKAYKQGKKYIKLKDSILSLKSKETEEKLSILDFYDISSLESKKISLYQVVKLKEFNLLNIEVDYNDKLKELFNSLKNYKNNPIEIKNKDDLKPYQIDGVRWLYTLYENNLSGILADDMGLGKSLELIRFLDLISFNNPTIIISPKSIIYNWQNELLKWNSSKEIIVITGNKEEREELYKSNQTKKDIIFIISYDTLRNDIEIIKDITFSFAILDEGQYISNAFAKKTIAVKLLNAKNKFVLTGTPIQNSLLDLWSIFDFILPNYFEDYSTFAKKYIKENAFYDENIKRLELLIEPFILRRKKEDVLSELPLKQTEIMYLDLNDNEKKYYHASLFSARKDIENNNKIQVLADLTKMRQICVDIAAYLKDYSLQSSKLETTISLIKTAIEGNHKILVFSSFVTVLDHLEFLLDKNNINTKKIFGKTSAKDRIELSDKFNYENEIKVMLVSLKAGGTGLNLIGADIVIILDPWWNIASEEQASDRSYRIGQKNNVTIYKLICKNTIEEKVIELQSKKKVLTDLIHDESNTKSEFTNEDIEFILG